VKVQNSVQSTQDRRAPEGARRRLRPVRAGGRRTESCRGELLAQGDERDRAGSRWPRGRGDRVRQQRLAVADPEQRHSLGLGQSRRERGDESAGNHPCNCGTPLQKCKVAPAASQAPSSTRRGRVFTAWMKFIHAANGQARGGSEGFVQELLARMACALAAASNAAVKPVACDRLPSRCGQGPRRVHA